MTGPVQVVWFKRDLRVKDHAPLWHAAEHGPVVGLYLYEPELLHSAEWDASHSQFIAEALEELSRDIARQGGLLITRRDEAVAALARFHNELPFARLWSHAETGNLLTYRRDQRVAAWCKAQGVTWTEFRQDGVVRRLRSREGWAQRWDARMHTPPHPVPRLVRTSTTPLSFGIHGPTTLGLGPSTKQGQRGGSSAAAVLLHSFLHSRGLDYTRAMSSPETASDSCSRLSPHFAWGCLSLRETLQATEARQEGLQRERMAGRPVDRRWHQSLRSFEARLHWHCHFMQKLEDEPEIEFHNFNRAYDGLREGFTESAEGQRRLNAWRTGHTGYPLVDACMRSVQQTGWLTFRMRAMVMSFASYHLWLHWRATAPFLARHFLDFEPGIHYSQAQMQSGTTGINTLRIYNPAKQLLELKGASTFVRRWVPELAPVPDRWLASPHLMPPTLQEHLGVTIGREYPAPVVDHDFATREAKRLLYGLRASHATRTAAHSVYLRHGSRKGGVTPLGADEARLRGLIHVSGQPQLELDLPHD